MSRILAAILVTLTLAASTASAYAATIPIANPSFEDDVLADNNFDTTPTAWTGTLFAAMNLTDVEFSGATDNGIDDNLVIPDGRNVYIIAGAANNHVTQVLGTNFVLGEQYTLTAYFGVRKDEGGGYNGTGALQLLRGDDLTMLAETTITNDNSNLDTFRLVTVNYTSTLAGVPIAVRALNNGPHWQFSVDQFSLTTLDPVAVPAPAALPAGFALLLAATLRRRPHRAV